MLRKNNVKLVRMFLMGMNGGIDLNLNSGFSKKDGSPNCSL
jgi:hypothetical protein